jgi:arylsulfatase A-like enzyme
MIAHWAAEITKPGKSDHPSAFWDFMPTVCEVAGPEAPAGIQGRSCLPTLTGVGEQRVHDFLYWEFHELDTRRALRQGDWKLVQYDMAHQGKPMLFNLVRDLGETNNLADQEPERLQAMLKLAEAHRTSSPIFPNMFLDHDKK